MLIFILAIIWIIVIFFAWGLCSLNAGKETRCEKCGYVHEGITIDCPNCHNIP